MPDVVKFAIDCERFGAQGITVHPRPDERHITRADVRALRPVVTTEFNIEGYPAPEFMDLVIEVRPDQVTLVPDSPSAVTSNAGWDVIANEAFLRGICARLREAGIRSSIFVDADPDQVRKAAEVGADRVEALYQAIRRQLRHRPCRSRSPLRQSIADSPRDRHRTQRRTRPQPRQPRLLPRLPPPPR